MTQERRNRGSALFYSLVMVTLVSAASMTTFGYARSSTRASSAQLTRARLRGQAECALADGIQQVWTSYLLYRGWQTTGATGSLGKAKTCVDYVGWLTGTNGTSGTVTKPAWSQNTLYHLPLSSSGSSYPVKVAGGGSEPATVDLTLQWQPYPATGNPAYAIMKLTASATTPGADSVTLSGTYNVGAAPWPGLQFGLLSNNINCIFCHAHFDNVARVYNPGTGQSPRVRVASLQNLIVRTTSGTNDDCDTTIAGTLYTYRNVYSSINGTQLSYGRQAASGSTPMGLSYGGSGTGPDVQFYTISNTGTINEPLTKNTWPTPPTTTPTIPNQNLYLNYPQASNAQPDGQVPQDFPSIVADSNFNSYVDDAEWISQVSVWQGQNASLATTNGLSGGSLTVANATVVPFGTTSSLGATSTSTFPTSGTPVTVTNGLAPNANYILIGTQANPITINGTVAFPGDVVVMGVIQGTGNIVARNNLYIPSDLVYNDPGLGGTSFSGTRTFGNGGTNAVAYSAGGNVLIGNTIGTASDGTAPYWTASGATSGTASPQNYKATATGGGSSIGAFTVAEMATFNRDEWAKTQQSLIGPGGVTVSNLPSNGGTYQAGYRPRFYTEANGAVYVAATLPAAQQSSGGTTGWYWNPTTGSWKNSGSGGAADIPSYGSTSNGMNILNPAYVPSDANPAPTALDAASPGVAPAVLSSSPGFYSSSAAFTTPSTAQSLGPWLGTSTTRASLGAAAPVQWINEANLYNMVANGLTSTGRQLNKNLPLEIDGLVYTNNAIFSIAKSGDNTGGKLLVNGSLVAADTGLLAPTLLNLNYDVNTSKYINVSDPTQISFMVGALLEH